MLLIPGLQLKGFKKPVSIFVLNLKFLAGFTLWFIYTFYYTDTANNDVYKFYKDAVTLHEIRQESHSAFWKLMTGANNEETNSYTPRLQNWKRNFDEAPVNENQTVIRFNALLIFISGRIYFVHILIMCFISYMAYLLIANALATHLKGKNPVLILLPLLLPSVLLWTAGVMKEPLMMLGIAFLFCGLAGLYSAIVRCTLFAIGIALLLAVKFYVLVCLLPAGLIYLVAKRLNNFKQVSSAYLCGYAVLAALAFNLNYFSSINPTQMLVNKQQHAVKEAEYFNAGSIISVPQINANAISIVKACPHALYNTLTQPSLFNAGKPIVIFNALENLLVLLLLPYLLVKIQRNRLSNLNLVLFLLSATLSYFILIGISTPVAGNLVRYKAPLLPLFIYAFILLSDLPEWPFANRFLLQKSSD